ncbi:MAG: hypothetical protein FIB04_14605 [Gammaproteobacteria bacterium]|nr:hypothetical protein [Gammaproteobacteria bacterium]
MRRIARMRLGVWLLGMSVGAAAQAQTTVGRTTGAASVSPTGAARYTIPLWVPPGTNGLAPELAITYDHRSGNGLLGVGFRLTGFSAIHRCSSTLAQDGQSSAVGLDAADRLCLDGQRLRLTAGAYGQAGSQYQTEVETFSRVTAFGTAGAGPAWFQVERRDGLIYQYGATIDSRIESLGTSTPREWALNRIRDRSGNYIDFAYAEDTSSGTYRPARIDYTGNANLGNAPYYSVRFTYEGRAMADQPAAYFGGGLILEPYRLSRIDVQHTSGTVLRSVVLGYDASGATGRSRLARMQECVGSSCLQPTSFAWSSSSPGWTSESPLSLDATALASALAGDTNGDGFEDLIYFDSTARAWLVLNGTASGLATTPFNTGLGADSVASQALSADLDGNGRRDVVVPGGSNVWQWLRYASATGYAYTSTGVVNAAPAGSTTLTDVDGDALDDFVYVKADGAAVYWRRNLTSGGTPGFAAEALLWAAPAGTRIASMPFSASTQRFRSTTRNADFNGDGRSDLLVHVQVDGCSGASGCTPYWYDRWQVLASRGTSLAPQVQLEASPDPLLADVNGDGLTDIAYTPNGNYWRVLLGTGRRGTSDAGVYMTTAGSTPYVGSAGKAMVADWDGDGRADLILPGTSNWMACRSLGMTLETCRPLGMASSGVGASPVVLDANGDGLADLVLATDKVQQRLHDVSLPDLMATAVDGYGVRSEFTYAALTRPDVHRASAGATHPVIDWLAPAQVVSRLTRSDGVGGTYAETYAYEGAKLHLRGRGFLGFARRSVTDGRTGIATVEDYLQDPAAYDRIGALASLTVQQSNGSRIQRTVLNWSQITFGAGYESRSFPYVASSTVDRYELDGTWVSSTNVRNVVDGFGTTTYRMSSTSEMNGGLNPGATHSERLVLGSVTNDTTNWCLGRPGTVQLIRYHTLPGGAQLTRTLSRTIDPVACRVTQQVDEPGSTDLRVVTDVTYDGFGNIAAQTRSATGQSARTTSFGWSNAGRFPQARVNAEGHRSTATWDPVLAVKTSETNANGLATQWQYDAFRRAVREIRPDGTRVEVVRALCGSGCLSSSAVHYATSTEQGMGGVAIRSATVGYDPLDREVYRQADQPGGTVATFRRYSSVGLLAQESVPAWCCGAPSHWTSYSYDALGRLVRKERPTSGVDSTPAVMQWQRSGLGSTLTDALGRSSTTRYDAIGNVVQTIDAGNADTDFEYDAFGNLVKVRDFRGNETAMTYDVRGRRTSLRDVDSGLRTFRYTAFGDLLSETNARGQTTTLAYDRLSRPLTRQEPEGTTYWTWGNSSGARNVGALASVSSPGFQERFEYDTFGRLTTRTASLFGSSFVTRIGYDSTTGLPDVITYPSVSGSSPLRVRQHYDRGRLVRLTDADDAATTFWQISTVDALGQVSGEVLGNGVQIASSHDPVTGLLGSRTAGLGGGADYQDLSYTWDPAGNLRSRQEGNLGVYEEFAYDSRDRLDFVRNSTGSLVDVDYDEIGNVTYKSDVGAYTYDATRKHAVVSAGANNYAYDANGAVVNASGTTIAWTSYDLPTRVVHPSGNYATFDYGPERARIRQVARGGADVVETVYVPGGLYERVVRNGTLTQRHYIVADGRRVAVQTRASGGAPTTVYLLEDHLGGVDGFVSSTGALLSRSSNQPFGARRSGDWQASSPTSAEWSTVQSTTPRGFTDQEHVDNLGLIHMNGRVYDPVLGRFLSPDPVVQSPYDSQSWNRYSYVRNNPLRYTDPTGFVCFNGHPAADYAAESCMRSIVEQVYVYMSRLYDRINASVPDFVGAAALQSNVAAAGSVGAGDAAYASGLASATAPLEEVVVNGSRIESPIPLPVDIGYVVGVNVAVYEAASAAFDASTQAGADAAQYYADRETESGNPLYAVPGSLAALWTPDTAMETVVVLGAASGIGQWSSRPFWQYYPAENPAYRSTWLTRGAGWEPPYATGSEAAANLSLPPYNPGTAVRSVRPPWYQYVRGPRISDPQPAMGPWATGGGTEYRVVPFEP